MSATATLSSGTTWSAWRPPAREAPLPPDTAAEDTYQQALQARVAATAEIEYLDGRLDQIVMTISRELLAVTDGNRTDPRYLKLFSTPPSTAMAPLAGDAQDQYVRNIVARLREDPTLEMLRRHADELSARKNALQAAVEKRRALSVPEASAAADRGIALESARRVHNRCEAQLNLVLEDRALVESYFVDLSQRGRAETSEVEQ